MPQYERIHAVEDLPGPRRHYQSLRSERRALAVYRNSLTGAWSKYASSRRKGTLYQTAMRLRDREEFTKYGPLDVEYRYDRWHRTWVMYVRYSEPAMDALALRDAIAEVGGETKLDAIEAVESPNEPTPVPGVVALVERVARTLAEEEAEAREAARRAEEEAERQAWIARGIVQGGIVVDPATG